MRGWCPASRHLTSMPHSSLHNSEKAVDRAGMMRVWRCRDRNAFVAACRSDRQHHNPERIPSQANSQNTTSLPSSFTDPSHLSSLIISNPPQIYRPGIVLPVVSPLQIFTKAAMPIPTNSRQIMPSTMGRVMKSPMAERFWMCEVWWRRSRGLRLRESRLRAGIVKLFWCNCVWRSSMEVVTRMQSGSELKKMNAGMKRTRYRKE